MWAQMGEKVILHGQIPYLIWAEMGENMCVATCACLTINTIPKRMKTADLG